MKYKVRSHRAPDTMGKAIFHYLEHSGTYGIPLLELKEVAEARIFSLYTSIYGVESGSGRYISMSTTPFSNANCMLYGKKVSRPAMTD